VLLRRARDLLFEALVRVAAVVEPREAVGEREELRFLDEEKRLHDDAQRFGDELHAADVGLGTGVGTAEDLQRAERFIPHPNLAGVRAPAHDVFAGTELRVRFDGRVGRAYALLRDRKSRQPGGGVSFGPRAASANRVGRPTGPQKMKNQIGAANDFGRELEHLVAELDSIVHVVHQTADLGLHDHIEEMVVEHGAHPFERRSGELGADAVSRGAAFHQLFDCRQQLLVHVFLREVDVGAGVASPEARLGFLRGSQ